MTIVETWLPYLRTVPWTQYATFTTFRPITLKSARRLMDRVALRVLRPGEKLFWAAEPFQLGVRAGSYHVHALIETRQSARQIERWYRAKHGRADVRQYDRKLGAAAYVAKYMTKGMHDYDMLLGRGETLLDV